MASDRGRNEAAPQSVEGSQTVERAIRLLELLGPGAQVGGLTVTEIAAALEVGRPAVYRLVRSLEARDYVRRAPDGRYRLGFAIHRLAGAVLDVMADAAVPVLRALADEVGATAHLTVARSGDEAVAVAVVEPSWTSMHLGYRVGSRHPLTRGAAGRAILAGRDDTAEWIVSASELQPGAHGLAAPVRGVAGVEASVGVVSLAPLDEAHAARAVVAASSRVAEALARPGAG